MIYRLIDLPANVIGFKAQWHVSRQDLEEVMIPGVRDHVEKNGGLNGLIILNNSVKHFRAGAFSGMQHLITWKSRWRRVAIVSESGTAKLFINFISLIMDGEFKVFPYGKTDRAIQWASHTG